MAALGDIFRRIRRPPDAGDHPDAAPNLEEVTSPEIAANPRPDAVTSQPAPLSPLLPTPEPMPAPPAAELFRPADQPAEAAAAGFAEPTAPEPAAMPSPASEPVVRQTDFNPSAAASPPEPMPPPAATMFPPSDAPANAAPAGIAEPVAPEPAPTPLPPPLLASEPAIRQTDLNPSYATRPPEPMPPPAANQPYPTSAPANPVAAGVAEPVTPEPSPSPLPTPQPAVGRTPAHPSEPPPPAPPAANLSPPTAPPANPVAAGFAEPTGPEPLPPLLPTPQPAAGPTIFAPSAAARPSQPPPAPPAADLSRPPEPPANSAASEPLPPPMPHAGPAAPPPMASARSSEPPPAPPTANLFQPPEPPANAVAAQQPPPIPTAGPAAPPPMASANYAEPAAAAPTPPPSGPASETAASAHPPQPPAPPTTGLFGPPNDPPGPPRPTSDFAEPDDDPPARIAVADVEADAETRAGAIVGDAPADPMMLNCPYCGASENRVGSRCNRCGRVIVRLPPWAQHRRQNWFLRRLSMRRIVAACVIVLFILFVVWINYPFAPNPIVLSRNIHTQITIDEGPGAWSAIGRDLRHSRNVSLGPSPPEGTPLWQSYIPSPLNSEPVVQGASIYIGSADGVYHLAEFDGSPRENWEGKTPGRVTGAVAVADTYLFFGSTDHTVNAWDAHTGDVRWSFPAEDTVKVSPVVANGLVYISSGKGWLYALDVQNGSVIWRERLDGNASAAVAVHEGKLFVGDEKGIFYIRSARTGQEHFRYRTPRTISGSPVVTEDGTRAYFASGGQIYAVDAASREIPGLYQFKQVWAQLWLWQVPGVPRPKGQQGGLWRFTPDNPLQGILSSPALAEDTEGNRQILYAGAHDHKLYALDATYEDIDNRLLWTFESREAIWASPLVVKDRVIFGDDAGNVYSLNRITGEPEWTLNLGSPVRIAPIISGDLLVVRTLDGRIHGIK